MDHPDLEDIPCNHDVIPGTGGRWSTLTWKTCNHDVKRNEHIDVWQMDHPHLEDIHIHAIDVTWPWW